ncbi:FAD-dependent oxidoreductase [Caulobacter sp. NIBR1757]|uniref:FAD-dependent oxidoreductase n=1 Tax=Caulobacter sp. NIBR1757 TaxID=3016000 RepID=UPI0022F11F52|nr:FAD-dependent oxidoreductase [Caulobacter sp. NIBR1757]WGM39833.1 Ferredoxin--NADP reductase [Caulobacter sp. NIBR1757]
MGEDSVTIAPGAGFTRFDQTFPILTSGEIERMKRFGEVREFPAGAVLFRSGQRAPGMFVVLTGCVAISQRDGLGHRTPIVEQGPGQFLAEVSQLGASAALVDAVAETALTALVIEPAGLRSLLVAEAELGERITRALILRRVALIEAAASGAVLIGHAGQKDVVRLQGFLTRNGQPHHLIDPRDDAEAAELMARLNLTEADLPLAACPNGDILRRPGDQEIAEALGMNTRADPSRIYDVAIVGAGPAGLATAVYAASEGLSVAVVDRRAYGGQAGASARIENYFGFPTGITGQALTSRGMLQAQKFGAELLIPACVVDLDCARDDGLRTLAMEDGGTLTARTVVVASGAAYRRLDLENFSDFEGRGVWYWASPLEAELCAGQEVVVVGGGNSAGQAAVYLSGHASKVRIMVRGPGLKETMSRYLIDRITSTANIELMPFTQITALHAGEDGALARVAWDCREHGPGEGDIANVFLFVGADPATHWLAGCGVSRDPAGFVTTGGADCAHLESSVIGVFAVGDARSGSVKRVGGAIGEGAQVVAAIHQYLAAREGVAA